MNRRPHSSHQKPHYKLSLVKKLATEGFVEINKNARTTANNDFGWKREQIIQALKRLRVSDFHKTEPKYDSQQRVMVDYYKALNIMDEQVYTHFRIEKRENREYLIICSFKRI